MVILAYIAVGILAVAVVLAAVGLYLALAAALIPVAALAGGAALAVFLLWTYLRAAQRVLAPRPAPADDPQIRLPAGGNAEPGRGRQRHER